jgi:hypothetical protein
MIPSQPEIASYDEVLANANNLDENSAVTAIENVLHQAAKAALYPVAKEMVLSTIHSNTGLRLGTLKQQLALLELELAGGPKDKALVLARAVIAKAFNKGAHVIRSADGVCWKYNSRYWEPTTDDVINNLLLSEAIWSKIGGSSLSNLVGSAKKLFDYLLGGDSEPMGHPGSFLSDTPSVVRGEDAKFVCDFSDAVLRFPLPNPGRFSASCWRNALESWCKHLHSATAATLAVSNSLPARRVPFGSERRRTASRGSHSNDRGCRGRHSAAARRPRAGPRLSSCRRRRQGAPDRLIPPIRSGGTP